MTSTAHSSTSSPKNLSEGQVRKLADLLSTGALPNSADLDAESREVLEAIRGLAGGVDQDSRTALSALQGSQTACIHVDTNRVITYANPATLELIASIRSDLEKAFPRADFDNLIGINIDGFHVDPRVQKRLLADPANLPFEGEITIGKLKFKLNVTALMSPEGEHLGSRLEWYNVTEARRQERLNSDLRAQIAALNRSLAAVEYDLEGKILTANDNFLSLMDYSLDEIQGKHHSMFVEAGEASKREYKDFWAALNRGEFFNSVYKRIGAGGKEVWVQASYNPSLDPDGKPFKIVEVATDVTEERLRMTDYEGQLKSISMNQAVIEFNMDGTIRTANENFCGAMGYSLSEIKGRHHGIFVDDAYRASAEYSEFWARLNRGEFSVGEFRRVAKGGREVWIQASYNPIFDLNGKPFKVVKYATDTTALKQASLQTDRFIVELSEKLQALASQDLTTRITGSYTGNLGEAGQNLNAAIDMLESALLQVAEVSGQVSQASGQIAEGSTQLAEGASTQASSIEEVSASLEEMSSMTSQNADNAMQAKSLADDSKGSAKRGEEQMAKLREAIDAIKSSSDATAKIVKTIDEISFQTNMLALNAAVEAARAGDAGKGFAVVAEEVRSLAQRSAQAAKNTAELIDGSSKNVDNGVQLTQGVQSILTEIADGTNKVTSLITEIAAASKEQSEGIKQITTAVDQMNRVTQENAASSEESSSAATQLDSQVGQMISLINQFTLSQDRMSSEPSKSKSKPAARSGADGARRTHATKKPSAMPKPSSKAFPLDDDDLSDF